MRWLLLLIAAVVVSFTVGRVVAQDGARPHSPAPPPAPPPGPT